MSGITEYAKTGDVTSAFIAGLTGAAGGAIAATGLGMFAQAGLTAAATAMGDVATQVYADYKKTNEVSLKNVNLRKTFWNAGLSGCLSLVGSIYGGVISSGQTIQGEKLMQDGIAKFTKAIANQQSGSSWSHLAKTGVKLYQNGKALRNLGRGISSVFGTILTWGASQEYAR